MEDLEFFYHSAFVESDEERNDDDEDEVQWVYDEDDVN